jgi:hypothetical protein
LRARFVGRVERVPTRLRPPPLAHSPIPLP